MPLDPYTAEPLAWFPAGLQPFVWGAVGTRLAAGSSAAAAGEYLVEHAQQQRDANKLQYSALDEVFLVP